MKKAPFHDVRARLVLAPPPSNNEEDDGHLSASEVAGLKLDAKWVILAACNTAAGGAGNAEALSGCLRAPFSMQARERFSSRIGQ
jgi:hypothetical protein